MTMLPADQVLDGELITEEEYRHSRARRLAEAAVAKLPVVLQTPQGRADATKAAAGHAVLVPFRYPAAVGRGLAVSARAWRA